MSTPRWERRSKRGVCAGMSKKHAGNAPLVLNFETGNITAQWNVVFDDWFSAVATNVEEMPDFNADEWSKTFGTSAFDSQPGDEETEPDLRPVQPTSWDIEDDTLNEEVALRQRMLASDPMIQPNQPTTPPTRTYSQATSEHVNRHSESPSQELAATPRASQQPTDTKSSHSPTQSPKDIHRPQSRIGPPSSIKKQLRWGNSAPQIKVAPKPINLPGSRVMNEVEMKPENDWKTVERKQTARKRDAPSPSPECKTECDRSRPKRSIKEPDRLNCEKWGGPADCSEENIVDDTTIEHIANHCSVHFAAYGIDCEIETELSTETIACLTKLNELSPHQFAQVFKAAGGKNPDILSHKEVHGDYENLKEWLAAALKEIRQPERKGVWTECLKSEAKGQQTIPCTWVF